MNHFNLFIYTLLITGLVLFSNCKVYEKPLEPDNICPNTGITSYDSIPEEHYEIYGIILNRLTNYNYKTAINQSTKIVDVLSTIPPSFYDSTDFINEFDFQLLQNHQEINQTSVKLNHQFKEGNVHLYTPEQIDCYESYYKNSSFSAENALLFEYGGSPNRFLSRISINNQQDQAYFAISNLIFNYSYTNYQTYYYFKKVDGSWRKVYSWNTRNINGNLLWEEEIPKDF